VPIKPAYTKLTKDISGPSIKAALAGNGTNENQISAQEQFELFNRSTRNDTFTENQLYLKWAELLDTLNDHPNLKSTLNRKPVLKDNCTLLLKINNLVQDELIKNNKPQLVAWLRRELKNSSIDILTEVDQEPAKRIIYTDEEKLEEMVRKNAGLALLKQLFHLDFDS